MDKRFVTVLFEKATSVAEETIAVNGRSRRNATLPFLEFNPSSATRSAIHLRPSQILSVGATLVLVRSAE